MLPRLFLVVPYFLLVGAVSNNISSIFRSGDLDAVVNFTAKRAVSTAPQMGLEPVRQALIASCVQILYVYRKFCATNPVHELYLNPMNFKLNRLAYVSKAKP